MAARLAGTNKPIPVSPRAALSSLDQRPSRENQQTMPPPSIPSQTVSAQELRDSAKLTRNADDRDDRSTLPPTEPRAQTTPSSAPSPRRRSPSPTSRPGTRPASQESRASGDRRSGRGSVEKSDDKRSERPGRESSRRERKAREAREAADRDPKERGRDRHGDRERRDRGTERDRSERDRERDKDKDRERHRDGDSHRDRDRERDRDRDRDRHRRDEKDRDRDRDRKDRERGTAATPSSAPAVDDRGLPSRPDTGRHRGGQHDESLGKRRRGTEDDVSRSLAIPRPSPTHPLLKTDRSSKRSSRKDDHTEDRSRRSSEKEGRERGRDSDRRRKDRDGDGNGKGLSVDTKVCCQSVPKLALALTPSPQLGDKRIPDGPASAKSLPPSTPSAPRAMTSGDRKGDGPGRDRDWKRDQPSSGGGQNGSSQEPGPGGSLRSRISGPADRDSRVPPQAPSADRKDGARDDDRDGARKRTLSGKLALARSCTGIF